MLHKLGKRFGWGLAVVLLAAGGVAVGFSLHRPQENGSAKPQAYAAAIESPAKAQPKPAVTVATAKVEAIRRPVALHLTGSLSVDDKSEVASNVMGIVAEVFIERGSMVKKGDLIVRLDPTDAQNALAEGLAAIEELRVRLGLDQNGEKPFDPNSLPEVKAAKLAVELAKANDRRADELQKTNAISREEFERVRTEHLLAVERLEQAVRQARQTFQSYQIAIARGQILKKAVDDTEIRAPFNGYVAERRVSTGERVVTMFPGGGHVATIVRTDPLRLAITVPQQFVSQIKIGEVGTFQTDAFPGEKFTAKIRYIAPSVASDSRSLLVEAEVPNKDGRLRPGLFVTTDVELDDTREELIVPRRAVFEKGGAHAVVVVRGGVAREQIVALGETSGERTAVASGLSAGESIVLEPGKVRDGDPISL